MKRNKLTARYTLASFRFFAVVVLATIVFSSIDLKVTGQDQGKPITRQEAELSTLRSMSENVQQVATILRDNNVDIDAPSLFTISGRKKIRQQLSEMPEMNSSKVQKGSLGGLVLAHELILPEETFLNADTVIIANRIVFSGQVPFVSGPHSFHMFALDSVIIEKGEDIVVTIDTSGVGEKQSQYRAANSTHRAMEAAAELQKFKNSDPNMVTINTSGAPGRDGDSPSVNAAATGYSGPSGESGVTGTVGKSGSCKKDKNGGTGEPGTDGLSGGKGGDGATGTNGSDANAQTIMIGSITGGYFRIIAKGSDGGDGGAGGRGGDGGKGGDGGRGGNGAACKCVLGLGEGGTGGTSGAGGVGGEGGRGGNGGAGGKGTSIAIIIPGAYYARVKQYSGAGSAGRGGRGGSAGRSGPSGTPGAGGKGGALTGCGQSRDGNHGGPANPAGQGKHGDYGDWGKHGDPGSLIWTFSDDKSW